MKVVALIAIEAAVLASMPTVEGHGYIVDPAAQWTQGYASNGYGSTIDTSVWGEMDGSKYGYGPNGTISFFKAMLPKKGGGSLAALIAKNQKLYSNEIDPSCGLTTYKDSTRSELPASQLTFTGFTHPGPCEVWCDDTKVLFDYDCQSKYSSIPAKMPYDESKCANANRLTFYWIAVHGDPWQVYTDCVWLEGGSGSGTAPSGGASTASTNVISTSSSATSTTANAPSTNMIPSTSTKSPSTATISSPSVGEASIAGEASTSVDETPATYTTEAPSTSTTAEKCSRRQ